MAPAIVAVAALSSVRAGTGNATRVSPAPAQRCPVDRQVQSQGQASARQGRGGRWPGALGPRLVRDQRGAVAGAMAPAMAAVTVLSSVWAGSGNAARFPRPCATVPCRPAGPGTTKGQRPTRRVQSARRGRGGRWPGALGPRLDKRQRGAVAGAMAPAIAAVKVLSPVPCGNRKRDPHLPPPERDGPL